MKLVAGRPCADLSNAFPYGEQTRPMHRRTSEDASFIEFFAHALEHTENTPDGARRAAENCYRIYYTIAPGPGFLSDNGRLLTDDAPVPSDISQWESCQQSARPHSDFLDSFLYWAHPTNRIENCNHRSREQKEHNRITPVALRPPFCHPSFFPLSSQRKAGIYPLLFPRPYLSI